MARYGNSDGNNKGKKYKKLQGWETATPENEARARAFMAWYGANFDTLRKKLIYKGRGFNDEVATDTALLIYDAISLKGVRVKHFAMYFFRAYHTNAMKLGRDNMAEEDNLFRLDAIKDMEEDKDIRGELMACDFNYEDYEARVDLIDSEILDYVRAVYPPFECSIFEIYIGLLPEISYRKLAEMLGVQYTFIWTAIGAIRKDCAKRFKKRKDYLLSAQDEN